MVLLQAAPLIQAQLPDLAIWQFPPWNTPIFKAYAPQQVQHCMSVPSQLQQRLENEAKLARPYVQVLQLALAQAHQQREQERRESSAREQMFLRAIAAVSNGQVAPALPKMPIKALAQPPPPLVPAAPFAGV